MGKNFDVAIVGGGYAGITTALALQNLPNASVTLYAPEFSKPLPTDGRATAIAGGPKAMFEVLGVWPALESGSGPVRQMAISDAKPGDGVTVPLLEFEADHKGDALTHIVPNHLLLKVLREKAVEQNLTIEEKAVTHLLQDAHAATLTFEDSTEKPFDLVIATDGARSKLRDLLDIKTISWPYNQNGLVAELTHSMSHEGVAHQTFLPEGPFATLPLADAHKSSLVWTQSPDSLKELLNDEAALFAAIEETLPGPLGRLEAIKGVNHYPLSLLIARSFYQGRVVLVGDAAHRIHPLAGQGLNLGLKDIATLAQLLADSLRLGLDPILQDVLGQYETARRAETFGMVMACDGLNRIFSGSLPGLRTVRGVGMGLVDGLPGLKSRLMKSASLKTKDLRLISGQAL